jgi:hypothetical protein
MTKKGRYLLGLGLAALWVLSCAGSAAVAGCVANGDGTVTDLDTGLMWQQSDSGNTYTWKDGLAYCTSLDLAGYADWRMPNSRELQSLVNYGRFD